jgi:hypothetical protein
VQRNQRSSRGRQRGRNGGRRAVSAPDGQGAAGPGLGCFLDVSDSLRGPQALPSKAKLATRASRGHATTVPSSQGGPPPPPPPPRPRDASRRRGGETDGDGGGSRGRRCQSAGSPAAVQHSPVSLPSLGRGGASGAGKVPSPAQLREKVRCVHALSLCFQPPKKPFGRGAGH